MEAEMAAAPIAAEADKRPQVIKKYYYKKRSHSSRNGKDPNHSKPQQLQTLFRSAVGRQPLPPPAIPTCHNGGFYEIDHDKLPPKSPIHLKSIRVVKVRECTSLDVTVSFPSLLALRSYFSFLPASGTGPELDERFVMSCNQAARILRRRVADDELAGEMHQESFWVITPRLYDFTPPPPPPPPLLPPPPPPPAPAPATSSCLLTLQCSGVAWGVRRRVKYIGRHRNGSPSVDGYGTEACVKEEKQHQVQEDQMNSGSSSSKKRKREAHASNSKHKHKDKKEKKKKKSGGSAKNRKRSLPRHRKERKRVMEAEEGDARRGKDRWSTERYAAAEASLLDVMRSRGACASAPILRQTLREEARKHIGDTGLLDHLLKHMAGKVAEGGAERFRRRHNADGAMEYWLEPAELAAVRRDAGVSDPYWVPPPGWKPGDPVSPVVCASQVQRQVEELAEDVTGVKRDMEQLSSNLMQVGMVAMEAKSEAKRVYSSWQEKYHSMVQQNGKLEEQIAAMSSSFQSFKDKYYEGVVQKNGKLEEQVLSLKEKYESVLQKNGKLEEQVAAISSSFLSFKEEMLLLVMEEKDKKMEIVQVAVAAKEPSKSEASHDDKQELGAGKTPDNADMSKQPAAATAIHGSGSVRGSSGGSSSTGGKRMARKSSFRICKPQGTFLWPNMASGMTISGGGGSSCPIVGPGARAQGEVATANAGCMATFASLEDQLMMLGGLPTPPSASSTNAVCPPKLHLLPSPTSPIRPPPPPVASAGNVPMAPSYSGLNLQPRLMEVSSSSSAPCGASLLEGKKKAMFEEDTGGSNVGTELALATPSYC